MFAEFTTTDGRTIYVNPFAVESIEDGSTATVPTAALNMRSGDTAQWVQGTAKEAARILDHEANGYAEAHEPSYH
jgi:hypothetical protein